MLAGGAQSVRISASSFRFAIGRELGWNTVRGDQYEVHSSNGRLIFEGTGEGHGVGLCQRGAEQMGLAGRSYRDILAFYYPGAVLGLTGQGLSWQRLGGETISLLTTHPDQDRVVLATAERLTRGISERVKWPLQSGIEIRVYPDLDTFRNVTGEPGWVAAHTEGRRIHLQPVAVLRSRGALEQTLSHELLHVLVESQAEQGLPTWFREGLVGFLEGRRRTENARVPADADLRQTAEEARSRRAYADAAAMVSSLVQTYGEGAVLDWVNRGLPPDVTKARTSQDSPSRR
jgi:stage II sporulation protein D